ncbi:Oidioi.mRNA.OKI2018_I69.chr1.g2244.t1.cds [Oikopleura dioica]|uniref:Oidioi.mRNA.OKI2018_I69.chr1.g2244.t1.cds n=1 Tax=Oikopleura dioica TaxID=34765 RepID=A0ABN7SQJ1_OIKDI|nr:Oidioi.mRNA.OKI2018_I69.chr1.g2244.t1.cds [Oikopleura dioica]
MDKVVDVLSEVRAKLPRALTEIQVPSYRDIPKKLKEAPLWVKISLGTSAVSYCYIRYKWTAMNDWGVPVLTPSLLTFGTAGHYAVDNGFNELADKELKDKNRKTVGYYRLTSPVIFTVDHELINAVFTTHFGSFSARQPDMGSFGVGKELKHTLDILTCPVQWRRVRQSISPSFSNVQLEKMMSVTKARLDILCDQIRNLNGEKINVKGVTGKYTMDGFLAGAMGVDLELEDLRDFTKSKEYMYFHEIFNPGAQIFLTVFIPGFGDLLDSLEIPIYATEAVRWFTGYCKAMLNADTPQTDRRNFLEIFKKLKITDEEAKAATKGLTHDEIISQIFVLFAAGFETTATLLQFAIYEICKNADLQERLVEEISGVGEDYSNFNSKKLPLLCATLNETLRLYAPAGVHLRYCNNDVVINGIPFSKGSNVEVPVDALHENTEYWGADACDFNPDRWISNPDYEKAPFFLPFGAGPRNCVGMRFANMQARLGLMRILKTFKLEFPKDFVPDVKRTRLTTFLLAPSKDIDVCFLPREYIN